MMLSNNQGAINLYAWDENNFGDRLSPYIITKLTGQEPQLKQERDHSKLVAVGSLINKHSILSNSVFWGTGILSEEFCNFGLSFKPFPLSDCIGYCRTHLQGKSMAQNFRALRGKLTRNTLERMGLSTDYLPQALSDPAILMPYLYQPKTSSQRFKLGLICHFSQPTTDLEKLVADKYEQEVRFISMFRDTPEELEQCIDEICSCDQIASTSLHGIIVSQTYGVPALFLQDNGHAVNRHCTFKFYDYFTGTQQTPQDPLKFDNYVELIPKLLNMSFPQPPKFRELCQDLLEAFPCQDMLKLTKLPR